MNFAPSEGRPLVPPFLCEYSFNKHKQIDTRHNNANNVYMDAHTHACAYIYLVYISGIKYIYVCVSAGCPNPLSSSIKKGDVSMGVVA